MLGRSRVRESGKSVGGMDGRRIEGEDRKPNLNENSVPKSLIEFMTPFLLAQVSAFLSIPCWEAVQLQSMPHPSGQKRMQSKLPGTLLPGLGSSSLLEEGAIVLKER